MSDASVNRKLAAILSADVVGYSRLMGDDEQATLATLTEYREVMREHITSHRGRVVDSPGDALLAEFPSAVQAVEAPPAPSSHFHLPVELNGANSYSGNVT